VIDRCQGAQVLFELLVPVSRRSPTIEVHAPHQRRQRDTNGEHGSDEQLRGREPHERHDGNKKPPARLGLGKFTPHFEAFDPRILTQALGGHLVGFGRCHGDQGEQKRSEPRCGLPTSFEFLR
jgi:hypothetical protein